MEIIKEVGAMEAFSRSTSAAGGSIAFVPTMGALHEGHMALVRAARGVEGVTVVLSIFVNPVQFGPGEDFASYPRDIEGDLRIAEAGGVDAVFRPEAQEVFPERFGDFVEVGRLGELLCGRERPGHFRGVATVVKRLFKIVRPTRVFLGKKDFQQLRVIEEMVSAEGLGVDIVGIETVREADGLARSSRNRYLSKAERGSAASISRGLLAASALFKAGVRDAARIKAEVLGVIEGLGGVEYVSLVDPVTLEDIDIIKERALVAVAVRFGGLKGSPPCRLIDNIELY